MFSRIANLWNAFWNSILTSAEKRNPKALLQLEQERMREQVAKYNSQLAIQIGMVEKLRLQVARQKKELEALEPRILVANETGDAAHAAELAGRYNRLEADIATNENQLQDGEKVYAELTKTRDIAIKQARTKIEQLQAQLSQTEMAEAQAALNEMASATIGSIGGSGDNLNRIEESLNERQQKAMGRARVAKDSMSEVFKDAEMKEKEEKAANNIALAKFLAKKGISPATTTPVAQAAPAVPAAPVRSMGPAKEGEATPAA